MVVKLKTPELVPDENAFIDSVVAQRTVEPNKTYFNNYANNWKLRVSEYLNMLGNPENIAASTINSQADKNRFINLYGTKNDKHIQKPILDSLRERELQFCPSCGEDGTPNTLDHYLPKKPYPEYSILSKNLFPMCDICQGDKGTKTVDNDGNKLFIHPYYDDFAENKIIELDIYPPYKAPTGFEIKAASNLLSNQQKLVNRHLKELNLQQRYSKYFKNQYMRLLKLVSGIRKRNLNVIESIHNFHNMEEMKAINCWGHIFYAGILADADLLVYLETGELPEFL